MKVSNAKVLGVLFLYGAIGAVAQNTFPNTGNVGIGTTAPPVSPLEVNGSVQIDDTTGAGGGLIVTGTPGSYVTGGVALRNSSTHSLWNLVQNGSLNSPTGGFSIAYFDGTSWLSQTPFSITTSGSVSVSTATTLAGSSASAASAFSVTNATPAGGFMTGLGYTNIGVSSVLSASSTSSKAAYYSYVNTGVALGTGLYIDGIASGNNYGIYSPVAGLRSYFNGNVGIGTTAPGERLEVSGNIKLSAPGSHIVFPDGSTQSMPWTGSLCGGDYAESVDISGDRQNYEAGDVLVLDPGAPGKFLKVIQPYSTLVAGIYSTKPGVLGRRQTTDPKLSTTEVPMAMVGVVPTKVSAENGPIKIGDLLVTSSVMGHAMKGTDRTQMFGAVVGKAMGNLESGTGVIEVLVTLQ